MNVDEIEARLSMQQPAPTVHGRKAAVMALLVPDADGTLVVPFTRRSYHLKVHPGEISLPGGSWDPADGEALEQTALRELQEELGVDPARVRILGRLPDVSTVVSGFAVAPYIGYLPERRPWICSDGEVDAIIEVPFDELLRPGAVRYGTKVIRGHEHNVIVFDYGAHHVWGATGRILKRLVEALCP